MSKLECPECEYDQFNTDWLLDNDLYNHDHEAKVKCPRCEKHFMARSVVVLEHEACTLKDYDDYGGFI